jgi:microcystin-dependent protein
MSDPFLAEIRIFTGNFAPKGWALCDGQLLPISQNTALFSLLGTSFGGDGKSNFALPNLQGMAPMFWGQGPGLSLRDLGETGGETEVTLLTTEIPAHRHPVGATSLVGDQVSPGGMVPAVPGMTRGAHAYGGGDANTTMAPSALAPAGGGLPHNNMQPYLTLTFIIALQGVFPARS